MAAELFTRTGAAHNWCYKKTLGANETVYLKMPAISPGARGVNDIGYQCDSTVSIYATLDDDIEGVGTAWQLIAAGEGINKTAYALKIVCGATPQKVVLRTILQ